MHAPHLFVVAGDHSGDIAAAAAMRFLREEIPTLRLSGLGGARLAELGQEQLARGEELAVMGFWEVAKRFRFFSDLLRRATESIAREKPDAVLLVDYPGFNLRLAARIRSLEIPIIYYIAPQVWAWGEKRVRLLRELVDKLIVILPFEVPYFKERRIDADFAGHYLLDEISPSIVSSHVPPHGHLALLPGSRRQEIERLLPPLLETAALWHTKTGTRAVVSAISGRYEYEDAIVPYSKRGVSVRYDSMRDIVAGASMTVVASGTATLETALIGRPMVIVYKTNRITWEIARRLVRIPSIGLANLALGERVAPELLQREVTPTRICSELEMITSDSEYRERMLNSFRRLPGLMGGPGASRRVARLISPYCVDRTR